MPKLHYILFHGHTEAMAAYQALRRQGISAQIAPTPRQFSSGCGVSVLIRPEALEAVQQLIAVQGLEVDRIEECEDSINKKRDRFC